ncbi:MAG TPA: lysophospholipid acyltransferase family protein [Syntrophorhabdaceae bacterium]|nr:lysophospholipid acyltransferase family protein [Syntrophorhabdaceae bacterium]HPP42428.1 lysophospholipid acyltransferase family protein [Syntrophorhabdaceae bacterium]
MILDLILIFIIKIIQQCLRILPEHIQKAVGVLLGRLAYHLLKKRRLVAVSNLKKVFKDRDKKDIERIARSCFEKFGINFVEMLLVPYIKKDRYRERFSIENRGYIDSALKKGRGIIAVIFHYSNWEIMGIASVLLGHDVVVLARPLKRHINLNNFLNRIRSSSGLRIIPNEGTGRDIMRHLKENRIVAVLADQREKRSRGVYVEFFGEKVPTNRGVAVVAMKTGAPVIPVYLVREGFLRYRVVCTSPIDIERKGNIDELVEVNLRKINSFLESIILEAPDEWFWVHRRWGRTS